MPKEITHILFADDVAQHLIEAGAPWLAGVLTATKPSYHAGSIATDTFYYALKLPVLDAQVGPWGEMVHGEHGEDTAAPMIEMLRRLRASGEAMDHYPESVAFAAGFLTHMALDMTMHPWVYALSGQYYDQSEPARRLAVTRHRIIETWIDIAVARRRGYEPLRFRALDRLRKNRRANRVALQLWGESFRQAHGIEAAVWPHLKRNHRMHMALLRLFRRPVIGYLAARVDKIAKGRLTSFVALFYPRHGAKVPHILFEQDGFIHPVTGLYQEGGFESLWTSAVARAVDFLVAVDHYLAQGADIAELAERIHGYNLSMGLPGVVTANAKHFQPVPLESVWPPER
jgi:hypothetical protein